VLPPPSPSRPWPWPKSPRLPPTAPTWFFTHPAQQEQLDSVDERFANFSTATDKQLGELQTTLDDPLSKSVASLQTKMDTMSKDTKTKMEALSKDTKTKMDLATGVVTKALEGVRSELKSGLSKTETSVDAKLKASMYCKTAPKNFAPEASAAADYKAGRVYPGMKFTADSKKACGKGSFLFPSATLYCTTQKRFCTNPTYCPSDAKLSCKKCFTGCDECKTATTCDKCGSGMVVSKGKCVKPSSCWQLKQAGYSDNKVHNVKLTSPKKSKTVDARCVMEGGRAHTMIPCHTSFGCRRFHRFNQGNSCKDYGYEVTPFRNRKHFQMAWDSYGYSFIRSMTPSMHIYKTSGGGGYTNCPMRKHSSGHCGQWRAYDGKDWWARDTRYSEPNGDYSAWCNLDTYGWSRNEGFRFNDGGCYHSNSRYFCGTADYDGKGAPNGN